MATVIRITIVPRAEAVPWQTKLDLIERIIRDDAEVLELFREVTTGKAGRPAKTITDNISNKATAGTSRSYVLSRLKRSSPELFAKVVAVNLVAHEPK